ncbi:MAG: transcription-repair coupling factor, partial [Spirochaetaceae bacterium]|nr:transcription-repair coupling factor [Spirochaetaceae bacterium]
MTPLYSTLTSALKGYRPWQELRDRLTVGPYPLNVIGPRGSYFAFVASQIARKTTGSVLIIVPTEQEAESLVADLTLFGERPILIPWWGSLPYRPLPRTAPVFGHRTRALGRLLLEPPSMAVCSLRAFLTPVPDPVRLAKRLVTIRAGDSFDPVELSRELERYGYSRVPKVTVRGEYALRGEVLDLFQPGDDDAIRIVFEWDEIEQIRTFEAETQTSTGKLEAFVLHPEREVVWDEDEIAALEQRIAEATEFRGSAELIESLHQRRWVEGEEIFFPLADPRPCRITDYLGEAPTVLFSESDRLISSYEALEKEYQGLYASERARREVPKPNRVLFRLENAMNATDRRILFPVFGEGDHESSITLACDPPRSFFGNITFLKEELGNL